MALKLDPATQNHLDMVWMLWPRSSAESSPASRA
jgi:hypothetical protein